MTALDPVAEAAAHVLAQLEAENPWAAHATRLAPAGEHAPSLPTPLDRIRASVYDQTTIKNIPRPEYLVQGVLPLDAIGTMYGAPGLGKTFVALSMAYSVASGIPWMGRDVKPGPVVYVAAEGARGIAMRGEAWEAHHAPGPDVHPIKFVTDPANLFQADDAAALLAYCMEVQPVLVIVDTLARCSVGAEENSAKDMGIIVEAMEAIRRATGATVMGVHHPGKDLSKGARGSNALQGAATFELAITSTKQVTTMAFAKLKDDEAPPSIAMRRFKVRGSLVLVPCARPAAALTKGQADTLAALHDLADPGGVTNTTWRKASGVSDSTFHDHLTALKGAGLLRNLGTEARPLYVPVTTEEGGDA